MIELDLSDSDTRQMRKEEELKRRRHCCSIALPFLLSIVFLAMLHIALLTGVHVHGRAWRRRVAAGADIQRELPLSSFYLARLPRRAAVACLVGAGNAHLPLPIAPVCLNMYSCFRYD
uniref:Uncharacterized protein n=1 Tax=Leersia perrieri TaxID=77586 RepID=A0A0D9UVZ7_9ORYZ